MNFCMFSCTRKCLRASVNNCPDALLPDGPVCPRCGKPRGASGVGGGSWVHMPEGIDRASTHWYKGKFEKATLDGQDVTEEYLKAHPEVLKM